MPVFALSNSDYLSYLRNPLVAPFLLYHNRVVSTFAALPPEGKGKEIAKRIANLVVAPFAYLALGTLALIGLKLGTRKVKSIHSSVSKVMSSLRKKEILPTAKPKLPREVIGQIVTHWTVKEVAQFLLTSRDPSALNHYWDNMTPELAAKNEGIVLDQFNGYNGKVDPLKYIEALKEAIKRGKNNPFQGFKRMQAALLAIKTLNQSTIAGEDYYFPARNLWDVRGGNLVPTLYNNVRVLCSFAKTGSLKESIFEYGRERVESIFRSDDRDAIIVRLKTNNKAQIELKNIWESVDKFMPSLLVKSKTFQQRQDEDLKKWNDKFKTIAKGEDPEKVKTQLKTHRKSLYKKTKQVCERGFYVDNRLVHLDSDATKRMIKNTKLLASKPLKPLKHATYNTKFEIVDENMISLAKRYKDEGLKPVALNVAHAFIPGGGVENGLSGREEHLFFRSNYHKALYPHATDKDDPFYPIPETEVIYTPDVQIFRASEQSGFAFHDPYTLPFIAAAQFEISKASQKDIEELADLDFFELNPTPGNRKVIEAACDKILKKQLGVKESYEKLCKEKMRVFLRVAASKGHNAVVLGVLGCDTFPNPCRLNAAYWEDVLAEDEFKGKFKKAGFSTQG